MLDANAHYDYPEQVWDLSVNENASGHGCHDPHKWQGWWGSGSENATANASDPRADARGYAFH